MQLLLFTNYEKGIIEPMIKSQKKEKLPIIVDADKIRNQVEIFPKKELRNMYNTLIRISDIIDQCSEEKGEKLDIKTLQSKRRIQRRIFEIENRVGL